jgi:hypothetical protein
MGLSQCMKYLLPSIASSTASSEVSCFRHQFAKMLFTAWLLFSLNGLASGSPLNTHTVHEKRHAVPLAWTKHSRAPRSAVLPVRIGLNQQNLEHADRFLEDISDPDSLNFGKICWALLIVQYANLNIQVSIGVRSRLPIRSHRIQLLQKLPSLGLKNRVLI